MLLRVGGAVMAGLLVLGIALIGAYATDLGPFEDKAPASATKPSSVRGRLGDPSMPAEVDPTDIVRRPLTPDDPLRLWIGGDSLAGSLGPSLGKLTGDTGVVAPVFDSRVSSGLNSNGIIDWQAHATSELARLNTEVAVFFIGTNDAVVADTRRNADGVAVWRDAYAEKTRQMMKILVGDNSRPVYWLGTPVLKDKSLNERARFVNDIFIEVARGFPTVTYVDAYEITDDDKDDPNHDIPGPYTDFLPNEDGNSVRMRGGDGIHFTPDGGDLLAAAVYPMLDRSWHITRQMVPFRVKVPIETRGSSRLPGTSRADTTPSSSSGSTTPTTASTAAPSTTTAAPAPTSTTAPSTSTTGPPTSTTAASGAGGGSGGGETTKPCCPGLE